MKLFANLLLAAIAVSHSAPGAFAKERGGNTRGAKKTQTRALQKGGKDSSSSDSSSDDNNTRTLTLTVINESFNQPFSGFFVMVHNSNAKRLYVRGQPSSEPLALLAENGDPAPLVQMYTDNDTGVASASAFSMGAPYFGGDSFQLEVEVSDDYPLVTIATMAIHTNDCFTALNGVNLNPGMVLDVPGLDAGSEENNEQCNSIPGPACASIIGENERSGNGEGFVHVHRGFFGIGSLPADRYEWRNPMMRVVVN